MSAVAERTDDRMVAMTRRHALLLLTLLTSAAIVPAVNGLIVVPGSSVTHLHVEDVASEEGTAVTVAWRAPPCSKSYHMLHPLTQTASEVVYGFSMVVSAVNATEVQEAPRQINLPMTGPCSSQQSYRLGGLAPFVPYTVRVVVSTANGNDQSEILWSASLGIYGTVGSSTIRFTPRQLPAVSGVMQVEMSGVRDWYQSVNLPADSTSRAQVLSLDANNDGRQDLFYIYDADGAAASQNILYLNDFDVSVSPSKPSFTIVKEGLHMCCGPAGRRFGTTLDANADGYMDIFVVEDMATHTLLLNNGTGGFQAHDYDASTPSESKLSLQSRGVVSGDFNGDGATDLFIITTSVEDMDMTTFTVIERPAMPNELLLNRNDGSGQFHTVLITLNPEDWPRHVITADFNGDGAPDLYVVNEHASDVVLINKNFHEPTKTPFVVSEVSSITDLFYVSRVEGTDRVFYESVGSHGNLGEAAIPIDYDSDGDLDVVVLFPQFDTLLFVNDGQGNFTQDTSNAMQALARLDCYSGVAVDVDEDNDEDLILACSGGRRIFLSINGHSFVDVLDISDVTSTSIGVNDADAIGMLVVDLDNDGRLDFVDGASIAGKSVVYIRRYAGGLLKDTQSRDGSGQQSILLDGSELYNNAFVFDANGDGRDDVLFTNIDAPTNHLFLKDSVDESFKKAPVDDAQNVNDILAEYIMTTSVTPFDCNNDGFMDIYVHSAFRPETVMVNQKDGRFLALHPDYRNSMANFMFGDMALSRSVAFDVDGDGLTDIMRTAGQAGSGVEWHRNAGGCQLEDSTFIWHNSSWAHYMMQTFVVEGMVVLDADNAGHRNNLLVLLSSTPSQSFFAAGQPLTTTSVGAILFTKTDGGTSVENAFSSSVASLASNAGFTTGDFFSSLRNNVLAYASTAVPMDGNNDGYDDLVFVISPTQWRQFSGMKSPLLVAVNNGDSQLWDFVSINVQLNGNIVNVHVNDVDGDGRDDLLVVTEGETGLLEVETLINTNFPAFMKGGKHADTDYTGFPNSFGHESPTSFLIDLDGDGDKDVGLVRHLARNSLVFTCGKGFVADGDNCIPFGLPKSLSVTPDTISTSGDNNLLISGFGLFDNTAIVQINNVPCKTSSSLSENMMLCVTPEGISGPANVTVQSLGHTAALDMGLLNYAAPSVASVTPSRLPLREHEVSDVTNLVVSGSDLIKSSADLSHYAVTVGGHACDDIVDIVPHTGFTCRIYNNATTTSSLPLVGGSGGSGTRFFRDFNAHTVNIQVNNHTNERDTTSVCFVNSAVDGTCICSVGHEMRASTATDASPASPAAAAARASSVGGIGVCEPCRYGSYSVAFESTSCTPCDAATRSHGAVCPGGAELRTAKAVHTADSGWFVSRGNWLAPASASCSDGDALCILDHVFECDSETACPGGNTTRAACGEGYDARTVLCGRCAYGYAMEVATNGCQKCTGDRGEAIGTILGALIGTALILSLVVFVVRRKCVRLQDVSKNARRNSAAQIVALDAAVSSGLNNSAMNLYENASYGMLTSFDASFLQAVLSIIAAYVQVFAQTLELYPNVRWPKPITDFVDRLETLTLPVVTIVKGECLSFAFGNASYSPYTATVILYAMVPWLICLLFYIVYKVTLVTAPRSIKEKKRVHTYYIRYARSCSMRVMLFVLTFAHPTISAGMFKVFQCSSAAFERLYTKQEWLVADRNIECFVGGPWAVLAAISSATIATYVLGWPSVLSFALWRWKRRPLYKEETTSILRSLSSSSSNGGSAALPTEKKTSMENPSSSSSSSTRAGREVVTKTVSADHGVPMKCVDGVYKKTLTVTECSQLDNPKILSIFGSLYEDYEDRWYWWGCYDIFRRLMQTAGVIVFNVITGNKELQLPFGIVVAFVSLVLQAFVLPYKMFALDILQLCVLANQALVLMAVYIGQSANYGFAMGNVLVALQFALLMLFFVYLVPFLRGLPQFFKTGNLEMPQDDDDDDDDDTKQQDDIAMKATPKAAVAVKPTRPTAMA